MLAGIAVAVTGVLLQATPAHQLEADIGLEWLFKLRGAQAAPDDVVVVTIDKESSTALNLPNLPRKWPRDLHAQLINRLHQARARVIAFDIIFSEPRDPVADRRFAEALKTSGNVILFDYLETRSDNGIHLEKHTPPIRLLQQAARAVAPFALPKVPEKIKQAWLYKTVTHTPTIPVVALQIFFAPELQTLALRINELATILRQYDSPSRQIQIIREQFTRKTPAMRTISKAVEATAPRLSSWLAAMEQKDGLFLNFYGAARAITTIPYHLALSWSPDKMRRAFAGKAVFVGFSERLQPEQKDGFYTVFTDRAGLDVSGVEIMATTFANLLENQPVLPASPTLRILMILGFGLVIGALLYLTPGYWVLLAAGAGGGLYLILSSWLFNTSLLWTPLTTPLLFQLPLALVIAMPGHYLFARRQRRHLDGIIRQYLPAHIADTAFQSNATHARREGETMLAATMSTDAEAFTPLSETLSAADLHQRINRYFQLLLPGIESSGGHIADINGDAVLALWYEAASHESKRAACSTALAIQRQLARHPEAALPTRIGLHWGEIALGNVGVGGHYEYRAVGETINTTSRLETLNKTLGTRILASYAVLEGCDDILYRPLGDFLLVGKSTPLSIYEIQGLTQSATPSQLQLNQRFSMAYQAWRQHDLPLATQLFEAVRDEFDDPVSHFYLQRCRLLQETSQDSPWSPVIFLEKK